MLSLASRVMLFQLYPGSRCNSRSFHAECAFCRTFPARTASCHVAVQVQVWSSAFLSVVRVSVVSLSRYISRMLRGIRAVRLLLRPSRQPLWLSLRQRVTRRHLVQEDISLRPLRRSVSEPMRNRRDAVEADAARVLALEEVPTLTPTPHERYLVRHRFVVQFASVMRQGHTCVRLRLQRWQRSSCCNAACGAARLSRSEFREFLPLSPRVSALCLGKWLSVAVSQSLYISRTQCAYVSAMHMQVAPSDMEVSVASGSRQSREKVRRSGEHLHALLAR